MSDDSRRWTPEGQLGAPSQRVRDLVERARAGGQWYEVDDTTVSLVETDPDKWWAGTVFEVHLYDIPDAWVATTFGLDIAGDEDISPASSEPTCGWVSWAGNEIVMAWYSPGEDDGPKGVARVPLQIDIDEEPTDEQLAELARLIATTCFSA